LLKPGLARVSLNISFFLTPLKWRLPEPFIAQGRTVTMSHKAQQVASGQVKPYAVEHHWPGVANDVFNSVSTSGPVVCLTAHGQQCARHIVASLGTAAVLVEWSIAVTPRVSKPHDYANHMFMRL
jgi:hypothetical protein